MSTTTPRRRSGSRPRAARLDWLECPPKKQLQLQEAAAQWDWLGAWQERWGAIRRSPLLWGIDTKELAPKTIDWVESLHAGAIEADRVEGSWKEATAGGTRLDSGLVALAVAYALPSLARELDLEDWWSLLDRAANASNIALPELEESPLPALWLGGELPAVLSSLLVEWKRASKRFLKMATRTFSQIADTHLDGTGLPYCRHWRVIRPWVASWTRAQCITDAADLAWPDVDADVAYSWLVRRTLQLTRGDGTSMLATTPSWEAPLVAAALEWSGDPADGAIAWRLELPGAPKPERDWRRSELPDPTEFSEWAEGAVLRSGWRPKAAYLAIAHPGNACEVEMGVRRHPLFQGSVDLRIKADGNVLKPQGEWCSTCTFSEERVDYLELELPLTGGWRLQRQWMLARDEKIVFWADAVLGEKPASLELTLRLPLGGDVEWQPEPETNDGWLLASSKRQAWVVPLAAPEWQTSGEPPAVTVKDGQLVVNASGEGTALYLPLFFDLHSRRRRIPLRTWRILTVGERLRIVRPDEAVGYRIQVGKKQWLVYRSLAPAASRTVLGQNLMTEFFVGRFLRSGEVEPYVEVESGDESES